MQLNGQNLVRSQIHSSERSIEMYNKLSVPPQLSSIKCDRYSFFISLHSFMLTMNSFIDSGGCAAAVTECSDGDAGFFSLVIAKSMAI